MIPSVLQSGDSSAWLDDPWIDELSVSYSSSSHSLVTELRGPAVLTLTATANGTGWKTTLSTLESAALTAGSYQWATYATATGVRVTKATGSLLVKPNLATQTAGYDGRTEAEKALAACEAAIASGASVVRYQVGDRMVMKSGTAEILQAISYWKSVISSEEAAEKIAAGLGNPRRLYVRFGRL